MEVNVLTEILFGFGIALGIGLIGMGFKLVLRSFEIAADIED